MLSGIKFIPGDQLLPARKGSDSEESGDERKDSRRMVANDGDGKENDVKKEAKTRKKKKNRRRSKRYSSDESESESRSKSSSGSEEERRSKRSRRKRRKKESFSDESESSDEYEDRKGGRRKRGKEIRVRRSKGKHSSHDEFSDDDHERGDDEELRNQNGNELARKEMGLEWMLKSTSRNESSRVQREKEPEQPDKQIKQTNPKELNPYLKDNGSGYPDEKASEAGDQLLSSSVVGDGGASWRLKGLKRAKEQAAREGRNLEDVVQERWSSLGQLAASVATSRAAPAHSHLHAIKNRKRGQTENSEAAPPNKPNEGRDYLRDVSSRNPEMRKPRQDNFPWKRNKGQNVSSEDKSLISAALSGLNKFANDGSFMDTIGRLRSTGASASSLEADEVKESELNSLKDKSSSETPSGNTKGLSANQLAAKILQLRMKGKHEEADKLSKEMEDMVEKQDSDSKVMREETVGSSSRQSGRHISSIHKKREDDADLHLAKKIMQNKQFSLSGRADDEYDFDGDGPGRKSKKRKEAASEENRFVRKQFSTQKERCQFCFENPSRPKHLVISIANFTYLMLPQWHPVVEGHCIILPLQHEAATRTVDQNVWEEIRNFKKCLLKMFAKQDKDVLFLETVIGLAKQRRHCLIECIPIPYQLSRQAPMYFKKAIDEAEDEWGQHEMKKLIPTSGSLRQVIPENFSYFHVEFGLDRGFVHVIDDESNFSSGFGLNVIRGLLRLPEEDMYRRRRLEPVEKQKLAVAAFMKEWEPFDWTRELE